MSKVLISDTTDARSAVASLFEATPPVLVEVRFPRAGTGSDWHLCDEEDQLERLLDSLSPGVEVYLSSVWDLKNTKGVLCLRKDALPAR